MRTDRIERTKQFLHEQLQTDIEGQQEQGGWGPQYRYEHSLRVAAVGKKIAEGRSQKIPYLLILGDKEAESGTVAVRSRAGDEGVMALDAFIERVTGEVRTKKN